MAKLKTVEDVQNAMDRQDKELGMLRAAIKSEAVQSVRPRSAGKLRISDSTAEGFGRCLKAIASREPNRIAEEDITKGDVDLETKAGLGTALTGDTTTGSYLIPQAYAAEVLRVAEDSSELLPEVTTVDMETRVKTYPKRSGVTPVFTYVAAESTNLTESEPVFTTEVLTAKTYALWLSATTELLEDSTVRELGAYFATIIGESWVTTFETQLLAGSGSPVTGLIRDTGTNAVDASGASFDDLQADDLWNMITALNKRAYRRNAKFICHPTIYDSICKLKNANGDYICQRFNEGRPPSIFGYGVILSDNMPDTGDSAANTAFLALGNPRFLYFGRRVALEIKLFDQTYYSLRNLEVYWRARVRAALNVVHPEAFAVLSTKAS